jgi:hypothetical protein
MTYDLFECDLCHDFFDLQQVRLQENGKQFLCDNCASEFKGYLTEFKGSRLENDVGVKPALMEDQQ